MFYKSQGAKKQQQKNWSSATEIPFAAIMIHLGGPLDGERF
jgi:hypothetical protein